MKNAEVAETQRNAMTPSLSAFSRSFNIEDDWFRRRRIGCWMLGVLPFPSIHWTRPAGPRIVRAAMTFAELRAIYDQPFFDLLQRARTAYLDHWKENEVQLCTLLSIKTGGCSEDCGYCAQSARYDTGVKAGRLMETEAVLEVARRARANGSTRFCMGAAWRGVTEHDAKFASVLETVREVAKLGMEACVTLGQLTPEAARQLRAAGVTAYNHNLDTSPEFYPNIVTTHTFEDRLDTIRSVQAAGMSVCCGGIIGMGGTGRDRLKLLEVLCGFDPAPES